MGPAAVLPGRGRMATSPKGGGVWLEGGEECWEKGVAESGRWRLLVERQPGRWASWTLGQVVDSALLQGSYRACPSGKDAPEVQ